MFSIDTQIDTQIDNNVVKLIFTCKDPLAESESYSLSLKLVDPGKLPLSNIKTVNFNINIEM